jgi:hypothetical protein
MITSRHFVNREVTPKQYFALFTGMILALTVIAFMFSGQAQKSQYRFLPSQACFTAVATAIIVAAVLLSGSRSGMASILAVCMVISLYESVEPLIAKPGQDNVSEILSSETVLPP